MGWNFARFQMENYYDVVNREYTGGSQVSFRCLVKDIDTASSGARIAWSVEISEPNKNLLRSCNTYCFIVPIYIYICIKIIIISTAVEIRWVEGHDEVSMVLGVNQVPVCFMVSPCTPTTKAVTHLKGRV